MFKQLIACFMLAALLAVHSFRLVVWVQFKLNQDTIAATLCENRDKLQMHCNGKCYLMKKLKQAEENAHKQSDKESVHKIEIIFFQQTSSQPAFSSTLTEGIRIAPAYHTNGYGSCCLESIFRPPKSIA